MCAPATMTCEREGGAPDVDASTAVDSRILIDGCTPDTEVCGDGLDQDCDGSDLTCAANDDAAGAIDVTAGGMFTGDSLLARDDVAANGCGGEGGRDLFYRVDLNAPQAYYFDTFGSTYDTVVRVYAKPCADVGTGAGAAACQDDSCGGGQSQVAVSLPAGESCIIVDQADGNEAGDLTLNVVRGGRNALPLASGVRTTPGDTCSSTNITEPIDQDCDSPGTGGKDHAYFFTTCPGQSLLLDADICPEPAWDPVLYVKRVNGNQIGCNDDSCDFGPAIANVPITGSTFYFLYVDGYDPMECGPYSLDTNLR